MTAETNEIKKLSFQSFETELAKIDGLVLVDFWAEWCGPCKQMNPVLDQLAEEIAGEASIAKVNVDESPSLAQKFGIQSIPTFLIIKDGKEVARRSGVIGKDALKALLS